MKILFIIQQEAPYRTFKVLEVSSEILLEAEPSNEMYYAEGANCFAGRHQMNYIIYHFRMKSDRYQALLHSNEAKKSDIS